MYFLAYFTLQGTLVMLNTLSQVEDHETYVRWIYLTTVLYMRESQTYARKYHLVKYVNDISRHKIVRIVHAFYGEPLQLHVALHGTTTIACCIMCNC